MVTGVGSHTTAVLRLVAFVRSGGMVPMVEGLEALCVHGVLSFERIIEKCPSIRQPLDTGLTYTVLRAEIADLCPDVMRILSECDNAKHDNYQMESFIHTMFNIHRRLVNLGGACNDADCARIAKQVSRGHNGEFVNAAECFTEFTRIYSGGKDKKFLVEIGDYLKTLTCTRDVSHDLFRDLAKLDAGHVCMYVIAIVKAAVSCPNTYNKTGKAKLFIPTDLSSIRASNAQTVLKAHKIMIEARDICTDAGINDKPNWAMLVGKLDVRLVMFVHDKRAPNSKVFSSLSEIACEFYRELLAAFPAGVKTVPCPWVAVALASVNSSSSSSSSTDHQQPLRELNTRGVVTKEMVE